MNSGDERKEGGEIVFDLVEGSVLNRSISTGYLDGEIHFILAWKKIPASSIHHRVLSINLD